MKTIIIGSGISGLTAGAALANAGHQVVIFEQYKQPGGVTASFKKDGYTWDLGQLLIEGLGTDEPLGLILDDLGVAEKISVIKDDRRYVFPDFDLQKPQNYEGTKWRIDRLKKLFPEEIDGLERYWRDYIRFTRLTTTVRRLDQTQGLSKLYTQLSIYIRLVPFLTKIKWSAQQLMEHYFQSTELQCVFISILADFFTPPSKFPGLGVFALNPEAVYEKRMPSELGPGAIQLYHYSIVGGIGTLVGALIDKIINHGGEIRVNSPVSKINISNGQVCGVISNGEAHSADVVIATGGAKETFLHLVDPGYLGPEFTAKVKGLPLMDSIFMLHLGVNFDPTPFLDGAVTYFYGTYDIEEGLEKAKKGFYHEGKDGFVVHVPSLHSQEMTPPGHHAMTIYTVAPDTLINGTWFEQKEEFADALIDYAERYITGLREHIRTCEILTPEDFRSRTYQDHHAFGGLAPVMNTPRVPHKTPVEGLWFIGDQSESGGGINNVVPAAYKVAHKISGA